MATIMVVDDDKDIRDVTEKLLKSRKYNVITAENGDRCLKLLKNNKPDLILMDILMPGTPVDKILPQIKNIKILMFSVVRLEEKDIAESGRDIPTMEEFPNVVGYIEKPVEMNDLLAQVEKALKK